MFTGLRVGRWMLGLSGLVVAALVSHALAAEKSPGLKFSRKCLMVSPNEGCDVGDVNKDGELDIVAGTCWFAGPDFVPRPLRDIDEMQDDYLCNNGDHLYDVDGDGWLDLVTGHWMDAEVYWFQNPGKVALKKGLKWKKNLLKVTKPQNEVNALKDIDGDGVPEWYVCSWSKTFPQVCYQFAKDAEGKPTLNEVVLSQHAGGHGFGFGDINGDGREDIAAELGWFERPEGNPLKTEWKFHPESALGHCSCPLLVIDVNGDGRNDLVWGMAHDYGLYWWEQGQPKADGTTTWTQHEIDKSWSQAHAIVPADLDGDGKPEIITGKRVRGHVKGDGGINDPTCIYYYEFAGNPPKFTRHEIAPTGSGAGIGMQIRVVDINQDGRLDVAVSGKTGTWVMLNEGK